MNEWIDNTGYWSDGAASWTMSDDEFYAHIRQESPSHCAICGLDEPNHGDGTGGHVREPHAYLDYGSYWWRVHNSADHSHVDSGTSPSLDAAKHHVEQRINWTRFPKDDWSVDEGAIGVTYDDWLRHRIKQHELTKESP